MTHLLLSFCLAAGSEVIEAKSVTGAHVGPQRLAVLDVDVRASDLDPLAGESLSAVLAAEIALRAGTRYEVLSRSNIRMLLAQQVERQKLGADTADTYAALGRAADAQLIVVSSVTRLDAELLLTLEMLDVSSGMVTSRQKVTYNGPPAGVVELIRPYVARLLDGTAAESYRGQVEVHTSEAGATVVLGDRTLGSSPVAPVGDLPIGRHRLQITKDGYVPYVADVVVNRNETTVLTATLVDEASLTPWYQKWWVWSAALAAAAAVTTVAIVASGADTAAPAELVVDQPLP